MTKLICSFTLFAAVGTMQAYMPLYERSIHIPVMQIGLLHAGGAVASIITRPLVGIAGGGLRAGGELIRLRREMRAVRRERRRDQFALGEAAFERDEARMEVLRERMKESDRRIAALEAEREQVRALRWRRAEDERAAASTTKVLG